GQAPQVSRSARFATSPLQGIGAVALRILVDHGPVPRETKFDVHRLGLAPSRYFLADDLHHLPALAYAILGGIIRVRILDINIGLVGAGDGKAPGDVLLVTDGHAGKPGLAAADHVPARGIKVYQVSQ